jgi:hypothetical protein
MKTFLYFNIIISVIVSFCYSKSVDARSVIMGGIIAYVILVGLLCHIASTVIKDFVKENMLKDDDSAKKHSSLIMFVIGCAVYGMMAYLAYLFYIYYNVESLFVPKAYPYIIIGSAIFAFCIVSSYKEGQSDE